MNPFAIELFIIFFAAGVYLLHPGPSASTAAIATPAAPEVEPEPTAIAAPQVEHAPEPVAPVTAAAPVQEDQPKTTRSKGFGKQKPTSISPTALRQRCTRQGIQWRDAHGPGEPLTREEMLQALQSKAA